MANCQGTCLRNRRANSSWRQNKSVMQLTGVPMANRAKLTEHVGAKKAKGAYAGSKKEAKQESNKLRRPQSRQIVLSCKGQDE